jgi:hypothetical protein
LKIPPFGVLYKKIKIAQYCLHLTWKREQDKEMHFQKHQVHTKKTPKFLPLVPLLPTKLLLDELKDKVAYITFTLQVSQGSALGTPTYRKSIRTFEEGDPQQWMEVIIGLKEIWAQNSIMVPTDMSSTAVAILKGDSLTSYEAAMEDNCTNPEDESLTVPMTEQHINDALLAVIKTIEKAIKREQGKHGKKEKKHTKVACAKNGESSNSDSSNESIHVMEPGQRIPRKKRFAQPAIRFDYKGNQVDIKDSESDDDRKMPAKISCKKPKKVAEPMDTEFSEETDEDEDYKANKEEKAFLKSIDKKENSDTDYD